MAKEYRLSTIDNPFDPFSEFDDWYLFDMEKGYNTCAYLARISNASSELTDEENDEENERAIDDILKYDPTGIYIRVERGKFKKPESSNIEELLGTNKEEKAKDSNDSKDEQKK